jgi:hypothetical protein
MEHESRQSHRITRRGLVKAGVGTAAIGAVAVGAGAVGHATADGSSAPKAKAADSVPPADVTAGQFVVHVRDIEAGTLDVYSGSRHMVVTDHDIASRLAFYTW